MNISRRVDEVFEVFDYMAAKLKMMQDDNDHRKSWTAEDFMICYTSVFNHSWSLKHSGGSLRLQVYDKYKSILTERINEKVLPSLINKNGSEMVKEVIKLWSEYIYFAKKMAVLLTGLIQGPNLDPEFPSHPQFSNQLFRDLVIVKYLGSLPKSLLDLLHEERERKVIDHDLNKEVLKFLAEIKLEDLFSVNCCSEFELIMLAETEKCYHQLSLEYRFQPNLFIDYIQNEEERVKAIYLDNATGRKLLEIQAAVLSDFEKQALPAIDLLRLEDHCSMEEEKE